MPLLRTTRALAARIDDFMDTVAEGALFYKEGVLAYLHGETEIFTARLAALDKAENRADELSQGVEAQLYRNSLIPEHRGDVLGLLENTDEIIDTAKRNLHQFAVECPDIPTRFNSRYAALAEVSYQAAEAAIVSARAFFRDADSVQDSLFKVHHFEREADALSDALKRDIFAEDLDLAHKIHLRYFALNVEKVSDQAKNVADRLAIYVIKRRI